MANAARDIVNRILDAPRIPYWTAPVTEVYNPSTEVWQIDNRGMKLMQMYSLRYIPPRYNLALSVEVVGHDLENNTTRLRWSLRGEKA